MLDPGDVAHVKIGQRVRAGAPVCAACESPYHQTVLVYDGTPETGELIAVKTLPGATAAGDTIVPFRLGAGPGRAARLTVRLLGHVAAREDDQLTSRTRSTPQPAEKTNVAYTGAGHLPALLVLGLGLLAVGTTMLVSTRRQRVKMRTACARNDFPRKIRMRYPFGPVGERRRGSH